MVIIVKKVLRWLWSFVEVVIVIYVILITAFILCRNKYGYTQFGDYTFHNVDLLGERNIQNSKQGDLLVVKNSNDIHVGDLIYYYAAFDENYIIRSDFVTEIQQDDYSSLYSVVRNDETVTVASTRVLGKYANMYHSVGGILKVLESRLGFLFLVLLPIMIVFIYQVYEFVVVIRYEKVEEDEDDSDNDNDAKKKDVEVTDSSKEEKVVENTEKASSQNDKSKQIEEDDIEIL